MPEQNEIPWVIQEQTKVKHQLLNKYIAPWMTILFRQQSFMGKPEKVVFVDGFSGPGDYWKDDTKTELVPGSPIIVAQIANGVIEQKRDRKVDIVAIDIDNKCVSRLAPKLLAENKYSQNWVVVHSNFRDSVDRLIADAANYFTNPVFVFVDPFGYSGFPMESLKKILNYPRTELFITFMVYDIVRFFEQQHAQDSLKELYGSDEYLAASQKNTPEERAEFLVNLFCKNLKEKCKAEFILPFRINTPGQGQRPKYYLLHVSNNFKALEVMKNEMAKTSEEEYGFVAIGINQTDQLSLFANPTEKDIGDQILIQLKSSTQPILFETLERWAYIRTPAISKNIKGILIKMESEEIILIERLPGKRKNTVTEGAKITLKVAS